MVVLVKALTFERDPNLGENLLDFGAAGFGVAVVGERTRRDGRISKRLPEFKHFAGAFTPIVVGRHNAEDNGMDRVEHPTVAGCYWL